VRGNPIISSRSARCKVGFLSSISLSMSQPASQSLLSSVSSSPINYAPTDTHTWLKSSSPHDACNPQFKKRVKSFPLITHHHVLLQTTYERPRTNQNPLLYCSTIILLPTNITACTIIKPKALPQGHRYHRVTPPHILSIEVQR